MKGKKNKKLAPRNPFVSHIRTKRSGAHTKTNKANRKKLKQKGFQEEL